MSAIITDQLRILNAKSFVAAATTTDNSFYSFIALPNATDYDSNWDVSPPAPKDNFDQENDYWDTMIALKKITDSDVRQVIRKITWTSGTTYDMYRHDISRTNTSKPSGATSLYSANFYVVNSDYKVYICLYNGIDPENPEGKSSLDEPTFTDLEPRTAGISGDGYIWKYLYTIKPSEIVKFDSINFMPVPRNWQTDEDNASVRENAATSEQLKIITVTNRGVGLGTANRTYSEVPIKGDGTGAKATIVVGSDSKVSSISVSNGGSGYTYGSVDLIGGNVPTGTTSPTFDVIIPPKGGHGADVYRELGAYNVLIYSRIENDTQNPDFVIGNQIARVGIVQNPQVYNSNTILDLSKVSAVSALKLIGLPGSEDDYKIASFTRDSKIYQTVSTGSTTVGRVVSYDSTTGVLKYWQDRSLVGFNTDGTQNSSPTYGFDLNQFSASPGTGGSLNITGGSLTLNVDTNFSGVSTQINNRTYYLGQSFTSGISNPEVKKYSGNILYVDNRPSITRSQNQKEDIKVILQFWRIMPQETNLNVSPYFDDFDKNSDYYQVLFKPGYPLQARELTTLQSTLQNQIESLGNHFFKEGSVVIPGGVNYNENFNAVEIQLEYLGISVLTYLPYLLGKTIRGQSSGIRAKVVAALDFTNSERGNNTLYVNFLSSDYQTGSYQGFASGEVLILEENLNRDSTLNRQQRVLIQAGQGFATTISTNPNSIGSAITIYEGVYYLRGRFVKVQEQTILLDQYSNTPSYRVGFEIFEDIITPDDDLSLTDNSKGFSNYTSPGADRLSIRAIASKIALSSTKAENFITLMEVENGSVKTVPQKTDYNFIEDEFARRTYEESGDYYIKSPSITVRETLNDLKGNNGLFNRGEVTYNGISASKDLGSYQISPLKAYVKGYEVETITPIFLDFIKPRTTKELQDQSVNYFTGPTYTLNRVHGSPILGISTNYTVSLRDSRVGVSSITSPGKEIGLSRVYDFALESGSYNSSALSLNEWDITLYDIQTYTEIKVNEPITLSVPTYIKGRSSGAVGYLRYDASNSGIITAYSTKGSFIVGERLIFDGIENTRVSTAITAYGTNDVKSLYGIVGTAHTFSGDVKQSIQYQVGQVNITAQSGVSTVSSTSFVFAGIVTAGAIVAFSSPGLTVPTFAKIQSVSQNDITISGVTTVSGICDGALPQTIINPSDFRILTSNLQSSTDNTLFTALPKKNISSVDLTESNLTIRRQFDVTISVLGATGAISSGNDNETFLPYDEERYVLIRIDGTIEPLSADKFSFSAGSKELSIEGLSGSGAAKLIATLRKINVKAKVKNKNKVKTIIVDKSKYDGSGIGATTLNDGLTFGNYPYGTRVQDEQICLLVPDVTKLYGIFESNDTSNPDLPNLTLTSLSGPTNKTGDLIVGEEIIGSSSDAVAIYIEKVNDDKINIVYLNDNRFQIGENIVFMESGITGAISASDEGDKDITKNYILDNGQNNVIYDYSKILRKSSFKEPTNKLKIVFESAEFSSADSGDLITASSYNQFDYAEIPTINGTRNSDILDIRPRVATFSVAESVRSPFEFLGRDFTSSGSSSANVLASDESILLSYSYYLPRIDKIFLSKEGFFQLSVGSPSDNPQPPQSIDNAIEVGTAYLPPYMYTIDSANIILNEYKHYKMSDINKLENRIKNLELYTSLSLLESDTSNLSIKDENGLDRFKSGFFVDDFSTTKYQRKDTIVKNSIDVKNSELRPTPYTTSIDLLLGSNNLLASNTEDPAFATDLIGDGIKRMGQVITLNYDEVPEITQPYATRVENVTPFRVTYYGGTIKLNPSSDVWVDTVKLAANKVDVLGNYTETSEQIQIGQLDQQVGFSPVTWGSWETLWTGENKKQETLTTTQSENNSEEITNKTIETVTKTGTSTRQGTRAITKEAFDTVSLGDRVVSTDVVPFMRSRNIEFTANRLKPMTRVYPFFDGKDVSKFVVPKLIEISMTSGTFVVGETVIGEINDSSRTLNSEASIRFRVAKQNHKYGPFNEPTDVYDVNPYERSLKVPANYSSTSTILNVDTFSLSSQSQGNYYGFIQTGMKLRGQTSGAEATVTLVRLFTDTIGTLIGSFFVPNPNVNTNPSFAAGTKLFRLSSNSINATTGGLNTTSAEEKFFSEGKINTLQENVLSVRNKRVETQIIIESQAAVSESSTVVSSTVINNNIVLPPPPPPLPTPVVVVPPEPSPVTPTPTVAQEVVVPIQPTIVVPEPPIPPTPPEPAPAIAGLPLPPPPGPPAPTGKEYYVTFNNSTGQITALELNTVLYEGKYYNFAELEALPKIDRNGAIRIFKSAGIVLTENDLRLETFTVEKTVRAGTYDKQILTLEQVQELAAKFGSSTQKVSNQLLANKNLTTKANKSTSDGFIGKRNTGLVGSTLIFDTNVIIAESTAGKALIKAKNVAVTAEKKAEKALSTAEANLKKAATNLQNAKQKNVKAAQKALDKSTKAYNTAVAKEAKAEKTRIDKETEAAKVTGSKGLLITPTPK